MKAKLLENLIDLKLKIDMILEEIQTGVNVQYKKDQSPVTEFDLRVHDLFDDLAHKLKVHLLSEEGSHELKFPCFVLDPLDGTKEFIQKIPECAVSFAYLNSADITDPMSFAWVYNPFTKEELNSETILPIKTLKKRTLVSRTEFQDGLFKNDPIEPVGSIAYKLLLLALGECDQVISKRAKNIWDIAAGTLLLTKVKGVCMSNKSQLCFFDDLLIHPELKWELE